MIVANQMPLVKYHLRVNHHIKIHARPHAFLVCNATQAGLKSAAKEEGRQRAAMSTEAPALQTAPHPRPEVNTVIPEWDSNAVQTYKAGATATTSHTRSRAGGKTALQEKFNAVLPRSRSYFGLKRRSFLIVLACAVLALLALIIGLAVGLTKHSKG